MNVSRHTQKEDGLGMNGVPFSLFHGHTLLATFYNKRKLLPKYLPLPKNTHQDQKWPMKGPDVSVYQHQCYAAGILLTLLPIGLLISTGGIRGSFI